MGPRWYFKKVIKWINLSHRVEYLTGWWRSGGLSAHLSFKYSVTVLAAVTMIRHQEQHAHICSEVPCTSKVRMMDTFENRISKQPITDCRHDVYDMKEVCCV